MPVGSTSQCSVQESGFASIGLLTPLLRLYPLPVRQASVLPSASFRFRLAADTLAVRLTLPLAVCRGLSPPSECALPGAPKKKDRRYACPQTSNLSPKQRLCLRGGLYGVERHMQARFIAVPGVLVENALGNGLVDRGERRLQQIPCCGGVLGSDRRAQATHHGAHPGAVG